MMVYNIEFYTYLPKYQYIFSSFRLKVGSGSVLFFKPDPDPYFFKPDPYFFSSRIRGKNFGSSSLILTVELNGNVSIFLLI